MFENVFCWKSVIERHRMAPLVAEREKYLAHLLALGTSRERLRSVANFLLHITATLELVELRQITIEQIREAAHRWTTRQEAQFRTRKPGPTTYETFRYMAVDWFTFHGVLVRESPTVPFPELYREYLKDVVSRFAGSSHRVQRSRVSGFLWWYSQRATDFSTISATDLDVFLRSKKESGLKPRAIASECTILRGFLKFAYERGFCTSPVHLCIRNPNIPKYHSAPRCPAWSVVERVTKQRLGNEPGDYRRHMVCLLCAVYGLRGSEIVRLRLDDFDWVNEVLTVQRSKRGKSQQFPLSYEVGNAVIAFLRNARPRTSCRHLLVSRKVPHGPIQSMGVWQMVAGAFRRIGVNGKDLGPHALRRSCATRLLRKGVPLGQIAEFLGHSDTKSVGIYVKHDQRSLRTVSRWSLKGVM